MRLASPHLDMPNPFALRLRRLLGIVGIVAGVAAAVYVAILWSLPNQSLGTHIAVRRALLWCATGLTCLSLLLLIGGSVALLGRSRWARRILTASAATWLTAAVLFLIVQSLYVLYPRQWFQGSGIPPWHFELDILLERLRFWIETSLWSLALLAALRWDDVLSPAARASSDEIAARTIPLSQRVVRSLSLIALVAVTGTLLQVAAQQYVFSYARWHFFHRPYSLQDGLEQAESMLRILTTCLLAVGSSAMLFQQRWGRRVFLTAAALWGLTAVATVADQTVWASSRGALYTKDLVAHVLVRVFTLAYPALLWFAMRSHEVKRADAPGSGFRPAMAVLPVE